MPLTKGYTCTHCAKIHSFDAAVFAKWNKKIKLKCDHCGAEHFVQRGVATPVPKPE